MTSARQLSALMQKNFIYNKRHYFIFLIEIFCPILLVLIFAIIRQYHYIEIFEPGDIEKTSKHSVSILDSRYPEGVWYGIDAVIQWYVILYLALSVKIKQQLPT
jgi:hypothetical protein